MTANSPRTRLLLASAWMLVGLLVIGQWLVYQPEIQVDWQTETEFESAGFNLLRSEVESGPFVKVNQRLIPASTDAVAGGDYSYVDRDVTGGQQYFYQLEDVDLTGNAAWHGPIAYVAPSRPAWPLAIGFIALLAGLILLNSARAGAHQRESS